MVFLDFGVKNMETWLGRTWENRLFLANLSERYGFTTQLLFSDEMFLLHTYKSRSRVGLMAKHAIHLSDLSKASFFFVFSSGAGRFFWQVKSAKFLLSAFIRSICWSHGSMQGRGVGGFRKPTWQYRNSPFVIEIWLPSRELTYPTLGKGKSSSNGPW